MSLTSAGYSLAPSRLLADPFLRTQVSTFFYEDESFISVFETFVNNNAHKVDLSTEEMKLECVFFTISCRSTFWV